jgi:hypothetical protein
MGAGSVDIDPRSEGLGTRELPGELGIGHDPGLGALRRFSHHDLGTGFKLTNKSE